MLMWLKMRLSLLKLAVCTWPKTQQNKTKKTTILSVRNVIHTINFHKVMLKTFIRAPDKVIISTPQPRPLPNFQTLAAAIKSK